jgi:hypothetical protein
MSMFVEISNKGRDSLMLPPLLVSPAVNQSFDEAPNKLI